MTKMEAIIDQEDNSKAITKHLGQWEDSLIILVLIVKLNNSFKLIYIE